LYIKQWDNELPGVWGRQWPLGRVVPFAGCFERTWRILFWESSSVGLDDDDDDDDSLHIT
jgi:hypothetical protein